MRRTPWLTVFVALVAACGTSASDTAAPTTTTRPRPARVVLVGDSIMGEVAAALDAATDGTADITYVLTIGTANVEDDWWDVWPKVVRRDDPDAVVVLVGAWEIDRPDLGSFPWARWYGERLDRWADQLTAGGASLYWLDPPPVRAPDWQARLDHVERAYRALAERRDDVTTVPTGDVYVERDPAGTRLRQTDGLHLCPEGAEALARTVAQRLGLRTVAGWEDGPWRTSEPAYSPVECPD